MIAHLVLAEGGAAAREACIQALIEGRTANPHSDACSRRGEASILGANPGEAEVANEPEKPHSETRLERGQRSSGRKPGGRTGGPRGRWSS